MSAVIEPVRADWRPIKHVTVLADLDQGCVVIRTRSGSDVGFTFAELPELESALLNARLWVERASKQRAELAAAQDLSF